MYLTQPLHKARRECPQGIFSIHGDRRQSNETFVSRVELLAGGLRGLGLVPGARVGMLAHNSDRFLEYIYATLWAGGVLNPVNTRWSAREIAYSLDDSDTQILIVDDSFAPMVETLRALCNVPLTIIRLDKTPVAEAVDYETLIAETQPLADEIRQGTDLAAILYTGGTTGAPKGVMLSHGNLVADALALTAAADHGKDAPGLHIAPLFHVGGLAAVWQFALRRAPQVTTSHYDPGEALRLIEREAIGDIFVVPVMLRWLVDHPDIATRDLSSLRSIRYGAAPMDITLLRRAMDVFPQAGFLQVYGQTECAPVVTTLAPQDHVADPDAAQMRSAGRPISTAEIKIVNETGKEVAQGMVGEIVVRGPTVMLGYWNKPEETQAALKDGWMHTGDAGRFDENGFLYVVDRVKDMIISGGENVYSIEVENVLSKYPGVSLCAVIGVPDAEWGERVHAAILPNEGVLLSPEVLDAHCRSQIAGYKVPRSYEFVSEMPLSAAGKIVKKDLRAQYLAAIKQDA
ncbi:long-chain-fatty-acid--CoA ligase [Sulfitobacter sp. F26204]|uniref:class I adenylate-forming enzyme family protein n=1 Tax=Sulfitobacter sp. F26204 TaxID=2996014 RepID=UPI00225E6D28|nr:long-chain-fatty-acid--CoA ligase [Sulfitobacter sp. F26204]MCX7560628.1 long-chain-fatty-acid--CoA ligase [Sulfitobacter sp. F26204]